jgi:CheY-like chemotaxis protein
MLTGRTILVAEDETIVAAEIAFAFEDAGARVVGPVATVEAALRLIEGGAVIDCAVIDLNLKGEMAFPIADALRQRGVRFVFSTGYHDPVLPARFADVIVVEKPLLPVKIAEALLEAAC